MILAYHSIHPGRKDALSVSVEAFEWQMRFLAEKGFHAVNLRQYLDTFMERGEAPPDWVAITFDDGYLDNHEYALPVLTRHRFPATFFVPTGFIGTSEPITPRIAEQGGAREEDYRPLQWTHIHDLINAGMSIGSHTVSHRILPDLSFEVARWEIESSKAHLESMVDEPIDMFCYPSGRFEQSTIDLVSAANYLGAVVTPSGPGITQSQFTMKRVGIYRLDSNRIFRFKLSRAFDRVREVRALWAMAKFGRSVARSIFR